MPDLDVWLLYGVAEFGPAVLGDRPVESFERRGWQLNVFAAAVPCGAAADPVAASRS